MFSTSGPPSLRLAAFGLCAGALLATVSGCPSVPCPNCEIKAAVFTVSNPPSGSNITDIVVQAHGEFTGHCPGTRGTDDCDLDENFPDSSLTVGRHQVTLTGWPFDANDEVSSTVKISFKSKTGGPDPDPVTIPSTAVTYVTVQTGDF